MGNTQRQEVGGMEHQFEKNSDLNRSELVIVCTLPPPCRHEKTRPILDLGLEVCTECGLILA